MSPWPLCAQALWGRGAGRSECNRPRPLRDPDFCFLGFCFNLTVSPSRIGRDWDDLLASVFPALAPGSGEQPRPAISWGKAWQRHPTWGESDKGVAERERQKVRESGLFLKLVEWLQTGL